MPQRLDPQAAYALWAPAYPPAPHNRLMAIEQEAVLGLLPAVRGLTVLDAGCGTGRYAGELAARGAAAIGADLSPAMLERARAKTTTLVRADLRALPFDTMALDGVVSGLALGDVEQIELLLAEFGRVLRPGGFVIYSVVHPNGAERGWARTFVANGRRWAIDGHWHTAATHRRACAAAGLVIDRWLEPTDGDGSSDPVALIVRAWR